MAPEAADMTKRNDVSVKVDAEVAAIAKMVASSRGIGVAEYLSETLRPIVMRELDREYAKRAKPKGDKKR